MEAVAKARFARISPRKARVIVNLVRGKNAAEALDILRFTRKSAAPLVAKLIDSAIANARDKDDAVNLDALFVSEAFANKAPDSMMRRWRPRAQGRATRIVKGMSHITVVLSQREGKN
ncbi:MAG: 50S ribosomal protein L22 [Myxococcales bacterium]|nr:MAG: 50S ribosomal protein L22 [Myxococcales bacterium]